MLKRIAALGVDKATMEAISDSADGSEVQVIAIKSAEQLPAATSALIAGGGDPSATLAAAVAMGNQLEELLCLIADALDSREALIPGCSQRVKEHASRFADALGLGPEDKLTLERASLVRDLGKTQIRNEVLLKHGALTYDEWQFIQMHPHLGADILEKTEALKDTAEVVRHHHECFDGDGYPLGSEGEAIPYLSRALKLLDVYCAMTSSRHYRKGKCSHEQAVEHMQNEAGQHFDPELAKVFVESNVGSTDDLVEKEN